MHAWAESLFETVLAGDNAPLDWTLQRQLAGEALAERLAGWQEKYPQVRVERDVVHERPTRALRRCAQTARLVVVGRRGLRDLVLGSMSQYLLNIGTTFNSRSVLAEPAKRDFSSPTRVVGPGVPALPVSVT